MAHGTFGRFSHACIDDLINDPPLQKVTLHPRIVKNKIKILKPTFEMRHASQTSSRHTSTSKDGRLVLVFEKDFETGNEIPSFKQAICQLEAETAALLCHIGEPKHEGGGKTLLIHYPT